MALFNFDLTTASAAATGNSALHTIDELLLSWQKNRNEWNQLLLEVFGHHCLISPNPPREGLSNLIQASVSLCTSFRKTVMSAFTPAPANINATGQRPRQHAHRQFHRASNRSNDIGGDANEPSPVAALIRGAAIPSDDQPSPTSPFHRMTSASVGIQLLSPAPKSATDQLSTRRPTQQKRHSFDGTTYNIAAALIEQAILNNFATSNAVTVPMSPTLSSPTTTIPPGSSPSQRRATYTANSGAITTSTSPNSPTPVAPATLTPLPAVTLNSPQRLGSNLHHPAITHRPTATSPEYLTPTALQSAQGTTYNIAAALNWNWARPLHRHCRFHRHDAITVAPTANPKFLLPSTTAVMVALNASEDARPSPSTSVSTSHRS